MRMLRWMGGKIRKEKIINEHICEHLGVASIGDNLRETHLIWFEYVQCRLATTPLRKCFLLCGLMAHQGKRVDDVDGSRKGRYEEVQPI